MNDIIKVLYLNMLSIAHGPKKHYLDFTGTLIVEWQDGFKLKSILDTNKYKKYFIKRINDATNYSNLLLYAK